MRTRWRRWRDGNSARGRAKAFPLSSKRWYTSHFTFASWTERFLRSRGGVCLSRGGLLEQTHEGLKSCVNGRANSKFRAAPHHVAVERADFGRLAASDVLGRRRGGLAKGFRKLQPRFHQVHIRQPDARGASHCYRLLNHFAHHFARAGIARRAAVAGLSQGGHSIARAIHDELGPKIDFNVCGNAAGNARASKKSGNAFRACRAAALIEFTDDQIAA